MKSENRLFFVLALFVFAMAGLYGWWTDIAPREQKRFGIKSGAGIYDYARRTAPTPRSPRARVTWASSAPAATGRSAWRSPR